MVTTFARKLFMPTYTAGMESRSRQQRNDKLNVAKVSNIITRSFIWATAAISADYLNKRMKSIINNKKFVSISGHLRKVVQHQVNRQWNDRSNRPTWQC